MQLPDSIRIRPVAAISALLFGAAFLASLILFFADDQRWTRRVLFFPVLNAIQLAGEERLLLKKDSMEEDIESFVRDLILGPKQHGHLSVLPSSVTIESILLRQRILYLNLSEDILFRDSPIPLNLEEMLQAVANNILFNFPRVRDVFVFVGGQIPRSVDEPLRYSRELVR